MLDRFIKFVIDRPALVIAATLLVTVIFGLQLSKIRVDTDVNSFIPRGDDALENMELVEEIFGTPHFSMIAIMREDHPDGIYNPETLALIGEITDWIASRPEFETGTNADLRSIATVNNILGAGDDMLVEPFMEVPPTTREGALELEAALEENPVYVGSLAAFDGTGAVILARASEYGLAHSAETYFLVRDYLAAFTEAGRPEVFHLAGRTIVRGLFAFYIPDEGRRLMPVVLGIVAIFLFLSFRTVRGVLIPVSVVFMSEIWMFGFLAIWDHPVFTITSILPILIITVAVANSIHLLAKYYDAQQEMPGAGRAAVVHATVTEMARPVFMTSLTTAIGFLSMTTSAIGPIQDFGIIMAVGIASAFVLSIAFVPALFAVLPLRPSPVRSAATSDTNGGKLELLLLTSARVANAAPRTAVVLFVLAAVIASCGLTLLRADSSQINQFPPAHHLRLADSTINEHFAGGTILDVLFDGREPGTMKNPEVLARIDRFQQKMEAVEYVGDTFSMAELLKRMNEVMHGGDESALTVPVASDLVAQYLLLYSISGDPGDFDDLVDYDYRYAHALVFIRNPGTSAARGAVAEARAIADSLFPHDDAGVPPVDVKLAGGAYTIARLEHHVVSGQLTTLAFCLPLLIALNWLTFGRLLLGGLTVLPVLLAILMAYGGMGYLGLPADIATTMLGGMTLGIGVDFAIHYLHKYLACRKEGDDHNAATLRTATTAGRALFFNALVLSGGFLAMLGARFYPQMKLGGMVAATMIVCYGSTMYLFPAVLGLRSRVAGTREAPREE